MKDKKLLRLVFYFLAVGLLVFFIVFNNLHLPFNPWLVQGTRTYLFSKISFFSSFLSELTTIKNLTKENIVLKEDNNRLLSQIAAMSELENENRFLRSISGMPFKKDYELTEARIFNIQFNPDGHNMLANKGSRDDIKQGDVVVSPSMVLIGRVAEVNEDTSRIDLITNPDFKMTVKLLDNGITGIARGVMGDGILLDFISQSDDVNIDNMAVTNGNDLLPSGLIIGRVNRIEPNDGSLFKKVFIKPEFQNIDISRVIILK